MVQKYIKQLNNRRSVINKAAANATAHGLLIRYPNLVGEIDVCPSFWAQSLLPRMDFKKRHLYHFPLYGIQTKRHYVSVGNETMALRGAKSVTIEGSSDHWNICDYDAQ